MDQTEVPITIIQKEKQHLIDVLVPLKQDMVQEETPKELQTICGVKHLTVFDPCNFQKTFSGTFLIDPFVWKQSKEQWSC